MPFAMMLGVALLLSVVAVHADAQTEAHHAVSQTIEAIRRASLANDAAQLDALMADDCIAIVGPGLLVTKPQFLSAIRDGSLVFVALTFGEVVIRIYGNTAVVTHVTDMKERIRGTLSPGRYMTMRVLVNGDRGWRLVAFQNTAMSTPAGR